MGFGAVEAHRQHARDVKRGTLGAVLDLMPARGAVGDDQRGLRRRARTAGSSESSAISIEA